LLVVRRKPLQVGGAAALGTAPWAALYAWLMAGADVELSSLALLLALLASPWATAPLTVTLGGLMFGERPRVGRGPDTGPRKLPSLFVYQGLLRLLILSCLAILGILIPMRLAFLNEVILLERGQGERSTQSVYRRCEQLIADRGGDLLLQCLLHLLFLGMFVVAFRWGVESALDVLLGQSSWDRSDPETYAETMLAWFFDLKSWSFQLAIWIAV